MDQALHRLIRASLPVTDVSASCRQVRFLFHDPASLVAHPRRRDAPHCPWIRAQSLDIIDASERATARDNRVLSLCLKTVDGLGSIARQMSITGRCLLPLVDSVADARIIRARVESCGMPGRRISPMRHAADSAMGGRGRGGAWGVEIVLLPASAPSEG
jgi:hypothetical protein